MSPPHRRNLTPSQAAAHLGVSAKALRLYEQQGLLAPDRTSAGWRLYSPGDVDAAEAIVALRTLGLSLAQIGRAVSGDPRALEAGLFAHEERLRQQAQQIDTALERVRTLRNNIADGRKLDAAALNVMLGRGATITAGFELPWPWAGEWFEMRDAGPLSFITGPLGSGKTRFAKALATELTDASFLGLDRLFDHGVGRLFEKDAAFVARVERTLGWLEEDGAERSGALLALVAALEADAPAILVIDMVEEGLSDTTQRALVARLRVSTGQKRAVFLMTRSSSILDMDLVRSDETVFYCPANYSPPFSAWLYPGGRGHEAVATCVAAPEVRARTAGTVAIRSASRG